MIVPLRTPRLEFTVSSARSGSARHDGVLGGRPRSGRRVWFGIVWVDRAEPQIRYLEVDTGARRVLLPITFAKIDGRRGQIKVRSILGCAICCCPGLVESGPSLAARRRSNQRLLCRRQFVCDGEPFGAAVMSHDDFEFEPIRGLPAMLPAGERLLWQGTPNWRGLAVRSYHVRKIAAYFAFLAL
jgi:hypothetical protein